MYSNFFFFVFHLKFCECNNFLDICEKKKNLKRQLLYMVEGDFNIGYTMKRTLIFGLDNGLLCLQKEVKKGINSVRFRHNMNLNNISSLYFCS